MQALKKLLAATFKLVIFIGVIGGGYYAYQRYTSELEEEEVRELPTVIATVRDITVSVSATGILQPVKIVEIKSKASGEILEMPVEMGDFLETGALIAQIDTRILDQELKQVEADYESAEIRLQIAQRQFVRAESLYAEDLISQNYSACYEALQKRHYHSQNTGYKSSFYRILLKMVCGRRR